MLFLIIAGCVISPRRVVNQSPSPTPTPTISPTPTPTPTPMAKTVPQFLFLGDAGTPLITGFRINSDGSLAPVPGSPFTINAPGRTLSAADDTLLITSELGITAFRVERETGFLEETDLAGVSITAAEPSSAANSSGQLAVLDSSGSFMYVVDANRAELLPYRVDHGKLLALSPSAIPIPRSTTSIAIVRP